MTFRPGLKNNPYVLFLLAAFLLLVLSFFTGGVVIDMHVHDTMFVIAQADFLRALAILLAFIWLIYLAVKRHFVVEIPDLGACAGNADRSYHYCRVFFKGKCSPPKLFNLGDPAGRMATDPDSHCCVIHSVHRRTGGLCD